MKRKSSEQISEPKSKFLKYGDSIPIASSENDREFISGLISIQDYLAKKRKLTRKKVRFNRPESFVNLTEKPDPRFSLTPEEVEWFYPASKNVPNWEYDGETISSAVNADKKYLEELLPPIHPPDSYFEEEELPYLLSMDTPLRYPPIYFIRKLQSRKFFIIFILGQHWKHRPLLLGGGLYGKNAETCQRYTITVLRDKDIVELVKNLAENLNGLLRISVDAYYSTKSTTQIYNKRGKKIGTQTKMGIIYPNMWGSVNDVELLTGPEQLEKLLDQIQPGLFENALLKNTFHRRDVYKESNVHLHRILAFQIVVTSFPPAWRFQ